MRRKRRGTTVGTTLTLDKPPRNLGRTRTRIHEVRLRRLQENLTLDPSIDSFSITLLSPPSSSYLRNQHVICERAVVICTTSSHTQNLIESFCSILRSINKAPLFKQISNTYRIVLYNNTFAKKYIVSFIATALYLETSSLKCMYIVFINNLREAAILRQPSRRPPLINTKKKIHKSFNL